MKKVLAVVLIILIWGAVISNAVMATTGKVTAETVRLRREANTSSDVMELIDENEEVEILDEEDGWYKVTYNGLTGYVSSKYIDEISSSSSNSNTSNNTTASSNSTNSSNTVSTTNTADSTSDEETNTSNSVNDNVSVVENNTTSNAVSNEVTNSISNSVSNSVAISNAVSTVYASEYTLSSEVELRKVPSLMAGKSSTISSGTQVTVTYRLNKWVKISDGTNTGWVLEQSL